MFHDFTTLNFQSRELTHAEKYRAEYLSEVRGEESPAKEIAQPNREGARILRNLFANASRFTRLA